MMTTTIRSTIGEDRSIRLDGDMFHMVGVVADAPSGGCRISTSVPLSEFLAAVAAELDVIVIPRTVLPKVTETDTAFQVGNASWPKATAREAAKGLRTDAMENLALAEYLAHPPVDEAQVEALADILLDNDENEPRAARQSYKTLARHILATGRVQVTA